MRLTFHHRGEIFELDFEDVLVSEWIMIERETGASPPVVAAGLEIRSVVATIALYWLARRRAGKTERFAELDFPLLNDEFRLDISETPGDGRGKSPKETAQTPTPDPVSTSPGSTPPPPPA